MVSELRKQLDDKTTEELLDVLKAHDLSEWRPEVFRVAKAILQERGVDVASVKPPTPKPVDNTRTNSPRFVECSDLPDPAMLMAAKSLLEAAELPFFVRNEGTQNLFGMGQIGGYNVVTGPPVLLVEAPRLDEARELLEPLLGPAPPLHEDKDDPPLHEGDVDVDAVLAAPASDTESSEQSPQVPAAGRLSVLELSAVLLLCVIAPLLLRFDTAPSPPLTAMRLVEQIPRWLGVAGLAWLLLRREARWCAPLPRGSGAWLWELLVGCVVGGVIWALESRTSAFLEAMGVPGGIWVGEAAYRSAIQDPTVRVVYAVATLCAAVYEETVFRVYLLRRLGQLFGGSQFWAVLVSATLFALTHNYSLKSTLVVFVGGLAYSVVYVTSRRLPCVVVAHWVHNLLVMWWHI